MAVDISANERVWRLFIANSLDADTRPIGDADNAGINDRAGHQHERGITDYLQSFLHGCIRVESAVGKFLEKRSAGWVLLTIPSAAYLSVVVQVVRMNDLEGSRLCMAVKKFYKILTSRSDGYIEEIEIIEVKQMISISLLSAEAHGIQP